jgi:hypothetical protein
LNNILILTNRDIKKAPRVIREVEALHDVFKVFVLTNQPNPALKATFLPIHRYFYSVNRRLITKFINFPFVPIRLLIFVQAYILQKVIRTLQISYVIIHEPEMLPLVTLVKKNLGVKIIFNAHEYHPLEIENDDLWIQKYQPVFLKLYKEYLPKIDLLINVCNSIGQKCLEEYGVKSLIIPNASKYYSSEVNYTTSKNITLVHHGVANEDRGIEVMIDAVGDLKGFTLDLFLVGDPTYIEKLKAYSERYPNISLQKPVGYKEIIPMLRQYDAGFYILQPMSYNNRVALPNKFFEFIQARLALVVSPNDEMKYYTEKYNIGIVTPSFNVSDVRKTLSTLEKSDIELFKKNTEQAAKILAMENYNHQYLEAVQNL